VYSPVDTLGESRTECVGASAFHDIDKSTRIKDHLKDPVQQDLRVLSFRGARALSGIIYIPWKNWRGLGKLERNCRYSSNLFRRWDMREDPKGSKGWYDVVMWVNRRMATTGTTRAIQRPKG